MKKTILVDAWKTFVLKEGIFEEMKNLLDEFENPKIIVSNATEEQKVEYGIVNMPYEVFSLDNNPSKKDPEFFKKLFDHFSLAHDKVIYFEHDQEAVKAAESLGISSFWYDEDKKDLTSLKKFLEENL